MDHLNKGGHIGGEPTFAIAKNGGSFLTATQWAALAEQFWNSLKRAGWQAMDQTTMILTSDPKLRRILRKQNARESKRQAIEARQVARAERGIEWAPPLLRNGRAAR
jgi:hypothetical protein